MNKRRRLPDSFFSNTPIASFFAKDDGDGGGGGGGGGGTPDIQLRIEEAVNKALEPVKRNRDEILNEKRVLKERLDSLQAQVEAFGGADGLKAMMEMRERLSKDELGKLLAEGKHDEWFERRATAMRADLERRIKATSEEAENAKKDAQSARHAYAQKEIDTSILQAASKAGVVDSAIDDVLLRASHIFTFDPKHGVVIKDESGLPVIGKDGKSPKGPSEWLEELKDKARHLFAGSRGSGAEGAMSGSLPEAQVAQMSMSDYREYRKKNGMGPGWAGRMNL